MFYTHLFYQKKYNLEKKKRQQLELIKVNEESYSELRLFYKTTLDCPCSSSQFPSISYVNLTVELHEISSSSFIKNLFEYFNQSNYRFIPQYDNQCLYGFLLDYNPLESFFRSNFICLYNETCLYGGFTFILRLIIPYLMIILQNIYYYLFRQYNNRVLSFN
ncbi:hypothetical protein I4U23_011517 [Adineta vaga]|nr:hypothetical protein I4U23_011517 [Adineta vaga]